MSDELEGLKSEIEQAKATVARAQKEYDEAESSSARKECLPLLLIKSRDLEQLRTAIEQLRGKELLLLQPHAAAGVTTVAGCFGIYRTVDCVYACLNLLTILSKQSKFELPFLPMPCTMQGCRELQIHQNKKLRSFCIL